VIGAPVQLNTPATEDHFYYLTESAFQQQRGAL
jgi:hypothetical protein